MFDLTGRYLVIFRIPSKLDNRRTHIWLRRLIGNYEKTGDAFQISKTCTLYTITSEIWSLEEAQTIERKIPPAFFPFTMMCVKDTCKAQQKVGNEFKAA